ncbi:GNAT family N-acetyltransferase [Halorubellus sp. JP-L1]|uniref:GNAT family N-acetyltransferase n=1 Tax=Halorubellus sp. JP-L1 TaxID=2715753 RepID=UPI00140C9E58|nr:GNAT family protein [Halorubellus sp. JP-L1]NHN42686.1 GNAT family N-acetyltransferase [Halorubellus sp. JP-L1]
MPGPVFIDGDVVALRTLEDEDRDALQETANHPGVRVRAGGPPEPFDEGDTDDYLEWLRDDDRVALAITVDGAYVGMVSLKRVERPNDYAAAGVHVHPDYQRQGYAREAVTLLVDWAFDQYGLHKVGANAYDFNDASRALLEDLGFRHEGRLREERYANGEYHDVHHYGVLEREWVD